MQKKYENILRLSHHVSGTRPRMSMPDRAAQFAPFAALTGYDAAVREAARLTDEKVELDETAMMELDHKLKYLQEHFAERPAVRFTYFVPDVRKDGGSCKTATGVLKKVDPYERTVSLVGGTVFPLEDLLRIDGDQFDVDF